MSNSRLSERALLGKLSELIRRRQFAAARTLLRTEMESGSPLSKRSQRMLLSNQIMVDTVAKRPAEALRTLLRRRALGFTHWRQEFDDALEAATLLSQSGRYLEAREELSKLIMRRQFRRWDCLLQAMELYLSVDRECRKRLKAELGVALREAHRTYGVPTSRAILKRPIEGAIEKTIQIYRRSSLRYQHLLLKASENPQGSEKAAFTRELQEFISAENVKSLQEKASQILSHMAGAHDPGDGSKPR